MGNIGAGEILFIAIFALLIFGPKKLPEISRQLGRAMAQFRRATNEFRQELEIVAEPPKPDVKPAPERRPGPRG